MTGPRRAAVLGHPIAHSLSPALHHAAYAALGLDGWRYDALDVTQDELPTFVAGLDGSWAGLSLTMPLKLAVLPSTALTAAGCDEMAGAPTTVRLAPALVRLPTALLTVTL